MFATRWEGHFSTHELNDLQSANREDHSTATALLTVHRDTAEALDKKCMVALVALDSSAAFDVIDHRIVQMHFQYSDAVTGSTLFPIKSYMRDRVQHVATGKSSSEGRCPDFAVPHRSLLRPRKFCPCSQPVGEICCQHDLLYNSYADDTQLYIVIMQKGTWLEVSKKLVACLADITSWMSANMLKLNREKTELIIFNPKYQSSKMIDDMQFQVGEKTMRVAVSERNSAVCIDTSQTTENQGNAISKICCHHFRNIGSIRPYITRDAWKTLAHALITSRLDYGNALPYGLPRTAKTIL